METLKMIEFIFLNARLDHCERNYLPSSGRYEPEFCETGKLRPEATRYRHLGEINQVTRLLSTSMQRDKLKAKA